MDSPKTPLLILLKRAALLLPRLEKLTPDLKAAHRASGLRRTLLRLSRELDPAQLTFEDVRILEITLERSFDLLSAAAREKISENTAPSEIANHIQAAEDDRV